MLANFGRNWLLLAVTSFAIVAYFRLRRSVKRTFESLERQEQREAETRDFKKRHGKVERDG